MKCVVTIPAYNEEKTIGDVIRDIQKTMEGTDYQYEIQVVDDGSKDNTAKIAKELGGTVYSHPVNRGLADTFRDEIKYALNSGADVIVHIDADGQYRAEQILDLIRPIQQGEADFVLGSRFMGTIEEMPFIKKLGNRAFSRVVSKISGIKISDAQTGFRAFTKEVAKTVSVNSKFTYTQEQIINAVEHKFRVIEVPIFFAKRISGTSRLMSNPLDYAIRAGVNLLRIYRDFAPLRFFGIFGFMLIFIGLITLLYGLLLSNQIFDVTITVLVIAGVQIVLFGFLAEMIKNGT